MRKSFNFITDILTKNWYVVVIILIAAFLRLYLIEEFITFLGDQGRDAIIIKRIVTLEHFPAIGAPSSIGQIFLGPFYYYFVAPFLLLFNFNPAGLAIGVAIYSLLGMIGVYYVVKKEINTIAAIAVLLFSTFLYVLVDFARFSWNPNLLPFFAFFTLYFFAELIKTRKMIFAFAFGSCFSLAFQLHHLAALVVLPPMILGVYHLIKDKQKLQLLKLYGMSVVGFLVFYTPLILFDLKHQFINSLSLIKLFTEKKDIAQTSLFGPLTDTTHAFFQHVSKLEMPTTLAMTMFFGLIIICAVLYKKISKNTFVMLHVMNFFVYIIAFSRLTSPRHPHYFGSIYLSLLVMIAFFITLLPKRIMQYVGVAVVTLAILGTSFPHYYIFFKEPNKQLNYAKKVAKSFEGHIKEQPIQVVTDPFTETDGHFRYYLEIMGFKLLPQEAAEPAKELYLMCFAKCQVIGNPQWQIAAYHNPQIVDTWKVENVTIYKLVQGK